MNGQLGNNLGMVQLPVTASYGKMSDMCIFILTTLRNIRDSYSVAGWNRAKF